MKSNTNRSDFLVFDQVAEEYDAGRPGYPEPLIDQVIKHASCKAICAVLEIGAGSGQATKMFAERGFSIIALEPGAALARIAASKLKAYSSVLVEHTTFESWTPTSDLKFDIIASANSFHWIDPNVSYEKCSSLLRPHGTLATFWNFPIVSTEVFASLEDLWHRKAKRGLSLFDPSQDIRGMMRDGYEEVLASGVFECIEEHWYIERAEIDLKAFVKLLSTYANFARVPCAERVDLLSEAEEVVRECSGDLLKIENHFYLRLSKSVD